MTVSAFSILFGPLDLTANKNCLSQDEIHNFSVKSHGLNLVEILKNKNYADFGEGVKQIKLSQNVILLETPCSFIDQEDTISEFGKTLQMPLIINLIDKYKESFSDNPIYLMAAKLDDASAKNYILGSSVIIFNVDYNFSNPALNLSISYNEIGDLANNKSVTYTKEYQAATSAISALILPIINEIPSYQSSNPVVREELISNAIIKNKGYYLKNWELLYNKSLNMGLYAQISNSDNAYEVIDELNWQFRRLGLINQLRFVVNKDSKIILKDVSILTK